MREHKTLNILITNVCWFYYNEDYINDPKNLVGGFHNINENDEKIDEGLQRGERLIYDLLRGFHDLKKFSREHSTDLFQYFVKKKLGVLRNYNIKIPGKIKVDSDIGDYFAEEFNQIEYHKTDFYKNNMFRLGISKYYFNASNEKDVIPVLKNIMVIVDSKDHSLYDSIKRKMHWTIEHYKKPDNLCDCHDNFEKII